MPGGKSDVSTAVIMYISDPNFFAILIACPRAF